MEKVNFTQIYKFNNFFISIIKESIKDTVMYDQYFSYTRPYRVSDLFICLNVFTSMYSKRVYVCVTVTFPSSLPINSLSKSVYIKTPRFYKLYR